MKAGENVLFSFFVHWLLLRFTLFWHKFDFISNVHVCLLKNQPDEMLIAFKKIISMLVIKRIIDIEGVVIRRKKN